VLLTCEKFEDWKLEEKNIKGFLVQRKWRTAGEKFQPLVEHLARFTQSNATETLRRAHARKNIITHQISHYIHLVVVPAYIVCLYPYTSRQTAILQQVGHGDFEHEIQIDIDPDRWVDDLVATVALLKLRTMHV